MLYYNLQTEIVGTKNFNCKRRKQEGHRMINPDNQIYL